MMDPIMITTISDINILPKLYFVLFKHLEVLLDTEVCSFEKIVTPTGLLRILVKITYKLFLNQFELYNN